MPRVNCRTVFRSARISTASLDLLAKVEYYLSHDKDRAEIAHNGFEKVQKYHTYPERLLQMIALAYGLS